MRLPRAWSSATIPDSEGQITVTGGTIDTAANPLVIGNFGAGAVTISSGALSVGTSLGDIPAADIGESTGSTGTLIVTGTSASFSALGQLTILVTRGKAR